MWHPLDPFGFGHPGHARHARSFVASDTAVDLRGLVVAVTGANSGIGLAASVALAAKGATVWMLCRDLKKAEAARAGHAGDLRIAQLDVTDPASIRALTLPHLDILVHNAGLLLDHRDTSHGLERTVATHLVGPWRLSHHVTSGMTIWVTSGGMYTQKLQPAETFDPPEPFDGVVAYARNKRAQVVVARHLGHQVMHPGWAKSPGVAASLPRFNRVAGSILRSPEEGADTIVWLACTRPAKAGFWFDRAPAPEHLLPWTRTAPAIEEDLLRRLRAADA